MRTRKGKIYFAEQYLLDEEQERREYEQNKVSDDLVQAHFDLVRMEVDKARKSQKQSLRNLLETQRLKITNSRANGIDPLLLFPKEIWTMILNYVTDENDIENCMKSCPVFKKILGNFTGQCMFGQVFPHFYKYLSPDDIFTCRQVCRRWCQDVDTFFENFYAIKDAGKTNLKPIEEMNLFYRKDEDEKPREFGFEYRFCSWLLYLLRESSVVHTLNGGIKNHPKNPFIGRSVTFREVPGCDHHDPDMSTVEMTLARFMGHFGEHIHHFTLFCKYFESPAKFYSLCQEILVGVKNMKSLLLDIDIDLEGKISKRKMRERPLPNHDFLESLTIQMYIESKYISGFLHYQDKLLRKYSNQLKRVDIFCWNSDLYHELEWNNLKELQVTNGNSYKLLNSLEKVVAPNLRELHVVLNGKKEQLGNLMRVILKFPKLELLDLKISDEFCGFSMNEIVDLPSELKSTNHLLKTLELSVYFPEISYDLLSCFPFLMKLIINHGYDDEFNECGDEEIEGEKAGSSQRKAPALYKVKGQVLELTIRNLYKSNVWNIIPSLKIVEVVEWDDCCYSNKKSVIFTREKYLNGEMGKKELIRLYVQSVRKDEAHQITIKGDLLRKRFVKLRADIEERNKNAENEKADLLFGFGKILARLSNYLKRNDMLSCRSVCSKWKTDVDTYFENYLTVDMNNPVLRVTGLKYYSKQPFPTYTYLLPSDTWSNKSCQKFEAMENRREQNPYLGRSIEIRLSSHPNCVQDLEKFLSVMGQHIWHVTLSPDNNCEQFCVKSNAYLYVCVKILEKCVNIKSLILNRVPKKFWVSNGDDKTEVSWEAPVPHPKFENHPSFLESLTCCGHNFGYISQTLVKIFFRQLSKLVVGNWRGDLECHWSWPSLRELSIGQLDSDRWVQHIGKMNAPELRSLDIRLSGKKFKLVDLLETLTKFPNLEHLSLQLSNKFCGFTSDEVIDLTPGFTSSVSLISLQMTIPKKESISYDFLICFPYLKRLTFKHGQWAAKWHELLNDEDKKPIGQKEAPRAVGTSEFVQLEEHILEDLFDAQDDHEDGNHQSGDNKEDEKMHDEMEVSDNVKMEIYKSNIWEVIPFLEFLVICQGTSDPNTDISKEYTRQGYDHFKKIQSM